MRIVHLYKDYFPPTVGGIEQSVHRFATWSVRHGAEAVVVTSHPGSRRTITETIDGVRIVRCAEWARLWSTPFGPDMPRLSALAFNTAHDFEHYGNIVTYMRLNKMVPPSSQPQGMR